MKPLLFYAMVIFSANVYSQSDFTMIAVDTPNVFGPGIISDGFSNRDMAISPEGGDLFYTLQWTGGTFSVILHSQKINGKWSKPQTAWFSGQYNDLEPAFSPDGKKLFFVSNRPVLLTDTSKKDYDIWYFEKKDSLWEGPFNMGTFINTDRDEFYPSLAKNGNLYFTRENGESKDDIFISTCHEGKYDLPVPLPPIINSKGYDFNSFIDPDENFIIFSSYKRTDDLGGGDLYFSIRKHGEWQSAVHFGKEINSRALDYSPFVSPDKKYFFFTSKKQLLEFPFIKTQTADEIRKSLNSFGNGNDDIYIMNFKNVYEWMQAH